MIDKVYADVDGNKCDLATMCCREPGWAANRIAAAEATIARVREAVAKLNAMSVSATVDQAANAYMDSVEEIEAALKGKA